MLVSDSLKSKNKYDYNTLLETWKVLLILMMTSLQVVADKSKTRESYFLKPQVYKNRSSASRSRHTEGSLQIC